MTDCMLIVDIGTSKVHTNLIGIADGKLLENRAYSFQWIHPVDGWSEVDALSIWESAQKAVEEIVALSKDKYAIKAIGFSYIGDSLVVVGKDINPLGNLILSFDNRAKEEAQQIAVEYGVEKLLDVADNPITPEWVPSKILWIKKNRPELFDKAAYFLNIQQFINLKLGLGTITDYTLACRNAMYDIKKMKWSDSLCSYLDIPVEKLGGNVQAADTIIGKIRKFGRVDLGQELPVILGAHDTESGMIGLGCFPGSDAVLGNITGTFDVIGYFVKSYVAKSTGFLGGYCGPLINSYVIIMGLSISGPSLDWFIKTFHPNEGPATINRLFNKYPLDGTNKVFLTKGIQTGDGCIRGINLNTTQGDLFKAIVEGVTYPLQDVMNHFEKFNGTKFGCLRIGGGGAKSDKWSQLKADMFNICVEKVENIEISSMGSAIFAGVGLGYFPDYESAMKQMIRTNKYFEPHTEITRRYKERYEEFFGRPK